MRDPDRHQNLIICSGPIADLPENFMQIRSEVFAQKLLTDRQTNNDDYVLLGGGNKHLFNGLFSGQHG